MAYQELTSVADAPTLIANICTFAAANGWTVERNTLVGAARTATIRIPGVTDYIHIYNTAADLILHRISVGYDGALSPALQPSVSPAGGACDLRAGPIPKVFMFANGNTLHLVAAISIAATYRFMSFGLIDKVGAYSGGTFSESSQFSDNYQTFLAPGATHIHFGQSWNINNTYGGYVRADCPADGRANFFHAFGDNNVDTNVLTGQRGAFTGWPGSGSIAAGLPGLLVRGTDNNVFSGRSVFHPIHVYVRRTGTAVYFSPIGTVPDIRFASLAKFDPEQEVTVGSDVWKVFPGVRKEADLGGSSVVGRTAASGNFGYAIRKVA